MTDWWVTAFAVVCVLIALGMGLGAARRPGPTELSRPRATRRDRRILARRSKR